MRGGGGLSLVDREHLRRRQQQQASEWKRWGFFVATAASLLVFLTVYPNVAPNPTTANAHITYKRTGQGPHVEAMLPHMLPPPGGVMLAGADPGASGGLFAAAVGAPETNIEPETAAQHALRGADAAARADSRVKEDASNQEEPPAAIQHDGLAESVAFPSSAGSSTTIESSSSSSSSSPPPPRSANAGPLVDASAPDTAPDTAPDASTGSEESAEAAAAAAADTPNALADDPAETSTENAGKTSTGDPDASLDFLGPADSVIVAATAPDPVSATALQVSATVAQADEVEIPEVPRMTAAPTKPPVSTPAPTARPTLKPTEPQSEPLRDESSIPPRRAALVMLTHDRPNDLRRTLEALAELPEAKTEFTIFVSCDHPESVEEVRRVAALPSVKGIVEDIWHRAPSPSLRNPLFKISEHYRFALESGLSQRAYTHLVVTEDDLMPAPDFLSFFHHMMPALDRDPTLWCVSAWHDNGFKNLVRDERRVFRTDFFPGLGWMVRREHWNNVLRPLWPHAPTNGWDHWIRSITEHEGRDCIAPEVPRVRHASKKGTTVKDGGKFLARYALSTLPASSHDNPYGSLESLYLGAYRRQVRADVEQAQRISSPQYVSLSRNNFKTSDDGRIERSETYLILYKREHYAKLAVQLGLWRSEPRASFEGIIRVANAVGQPSLLLAERRDAHHLLRPHEAITPLEDLEPTVADPHEDCESACAKKNMDCVAEQLPFLNKCSVMKQHFACESGCSSQIGLELPAYVIETRNEAAKQCLLSYSESLSCSALHAATQRLCPCLPRAPDTVSAALSSGSTSFTSSASTSSLLSSSASVASSDTGGFAGP